MKHTFHGIYFFNSTSFDTKKYNSLVNMNPEKVTDEWYQFTPFTC
jgi:hypothetical protein